MGSSLAAVILAAGRSIRLRGPKDEPKSLIDLAGMSMLGRTIEIFRRAGVDHVLVVVPACGSLAMEAERHRAATVQGPPPGSDMFTSVLAGVSSLPPRIDGFLILPSDMPLVLPSTVWTLADRFRSGQSLVIHPRHRGRRGHPPLIAASLARHLLSWSGSHGLRGFLSGIEEGVEEVDTDDAGILFDVDTPKDLEQARGILSSRFASACRKTLFGLPEEIQLLRQDS